MLETARKGKETFQSILALRNEVEHSTLTLGKRAENARTLLNHLYQHPFITPKEVADLLETTHQTASALIRDFENLDILKKAPKIERSQAYTFQRYLSLFLD